MRTLLRFIGLSAAAIALLVSLNQGFAAKPGGGGTPPPPLPPVRYYTTAVSLLAGATGGYRNDMNNGAQVVGWCTGDTMPKTGFLFDPSRNPNQAIDLNSLVTAGIPAGWRIASGVGINDWGVVVGYLENDFGDRRGFAMDLEVANPVVDLLPDFGTNHSYGRRINENGDILGVFTDAQGAPHWYYFNPGLYGPGWERLARAAGPLNFSGDTPSLLPVVSEWNAELNNPVPGRPAQIAGMVAGTRTPFRYTLGAATAEQFPELVLQSGLMGINVDGTFCGMLRTSVIIKNRTVSAYVPFRFNNSTAGPDILSTGNTGNDSAAYINSTGDVVLSTDPAWRPAGRGGRQAPPGGRRGGEGRNAGGGEPRALTEANRK